MPERATAVVKASARPRGVVAETARVIVQVVLWFVLITSILVLAGLCYALVGGAHARFNVRAVPAWFLHLSRDQWIALGVGLVVAALLVALPCSKIAARSRRIISALGLLAVLFLYAIGVNAAYHVSRALGSSRDWAIIHAVYSWVYVGFSFAGWMVNHWKQPLGETLRRFGKMLG